MLLPTELIRVLVVASFLLRALPLSYGPFEILMGPVRIELTSRPLIVVIHCCKKLWLYIFVIILTLAGSGFEPPTSRLWAWRNSLYSTLLLWCGQQWGFDIFEGLSLFVVLHYTIMYSF